MCVWNIASNQAPGMSAFRNWEPPSLTHSGHGDCPKAAVAKSEPQFKSGLSHFTAAAVFLLLETVPRRPIDSRFPPGPIAAQSSGSRPKIPEFLDQLLFC